MVAALTLLWERGHSGVALVGGCDLRLGIRGKHGSRMSHLVSIIRGEELWWDQIKVVAERPGEVARF